MSLVKIHPNAVLVLCSADFMELVHGKAYEQLPGARVVVLPDGTLYQQIVAAAKDLSVAGPPSGAPPAGDSGAPPGPPPPFSPPSGAPPAP